MDAPSKVESSQRKARPQVKKSFSECALPTMKALLQSQKELCTVSTEQLEEQDNFNEVTFLCFADQAAVAPKELVAMSVELPDLLRSLHSCSLHENEVIFLKNIHKPLENNDIPKQKKYSSQILCVMRLSPSFPRFRVDSICSLLNKYSAGLRCSLEMYSLQKNLSDLPRTEDDDTNQSVSSIEDDFVTALEHLDEDESTKIAKSGHVTPEKRQDAISQTVSDTSSESLDQKIIVNSLCRKPSVKSSSSLFNILEHKELSTVRNLVTTSISDPWIQKSFFRSHNSDHNINVHKTLFSSSPAESSESDCSSPSPVIFLDEEGYQKSLKAKLQLPKIPVMKDGIEDSDSEVSEFFDSFDQFDEQEQILGNGCKQARDSTTGNPPQKKMITYKKSCPATTVMNPQKFKFDRPILPANVRKPTPRKPESPYSNLLEVPDSPRPVKMSGDDSGCLFSPIRSSAFSPLGNCITTECLCQTGINREAVNQNHNLVYRSYSDFANNISFEILGSVFNSRSPSSHKCVQEVSNCNKFISGEEKAHNAKTKEDIFGKGLKKKSKSKCKPLMIRDHIQKFASELVERSFGNAFKDLQKGVSSCTNALCHLAAKLTSSVFQMAFYEIGRQQAFLLKKKALNGLAGLLVSEAITGALKELQSVKRQIFTNTVAKFAADLAEELIFEGIMEVCQFSYPPTPTTSQSQSFHYNHKVVRSYAKDLSESVIQEAFIELSQADVTFKTQAAISISADNVQYVRAEHMFEPTQTFNSSLEIHDKLPVALKPVQEFGKDYTVHKALFYTSGIASSIPVPLAGNILCQNQILSPDPRLRNHLPLNDQMKLYKDSSELCCRTKKKDGEVTSVRSIYVTTGNTPDNECNNHILYTQSDFKGTKNPEMSDFSDLTGMPTISNFSGKMVDMIVTEAYETVTTSRASKSSQQYTDVLQMEKMPYLQCIGEDTCKNMFGNYLAKQIVKETVDETKSTCSATSEKLAYCVGLGTTTKSSRKELLTPTKQSERNKNIPVIVGQKQMPLNSSSKLYGTPMYSNRFLLSGSKSCVQEKKKLETCRTSTCTPPPSTVAFVKPFETYPHPESCSAKSLSVPQEKSNICQATVCSAVDTERAFLSTKSISSVAFNCEDGLQMEDKLSNTDGNLSVDTPDTPPPTPLTPSQASSEWNLRKLTKKLKGELAKEFAPATPPSTPYRSETDDKYENHCYNLEKEEFMLKLMRSLSEEVESSEDEELSEAERVKTSVRTTEYANGLATQIISMATEMAASCLDDTAFHVECNKCFQASTNYKGCGYAAFISVPERSIESVWAYAGDMAGKVISEAKNVVKSRHHKLLRLKQVNHKADNFNSRRKSHECFPKSKKFPLGDQQSKDTDSFSLSVPENSEASGLISKYPSCESVTDEYADHIIRILKSEGGHNELIMDQFASRIVYRCIKSGMQQAARKLQIKYNRKISSAPSSKLNNKLELFDVVKKGVDIKKHKKGNNQFAKQPSGNKCHIHRTESMKLVDFSESLAYSITSDVRRKLMSASCLPKSLTDSCLYEKSKVDKVTDVKTPFSKMPSFHCKDKLYHSTGSLNECSYRDDIINAIEQYARKVVDDALNLESTTLKTSQNWTNGERSTYAGKFSPFSVTACRYCSMKEHQYCTENSYFQLTGQEHSKIHQIPSTSDICPKSHVLHLDIPRIHIDRDENVMFADNMLAVAFDGAGRQLSNTSLAADSGIGQDGISFAESLTTEIMTSCMTNIGPALNISCMGKEGFYSADSIVSQQMSLSNGDDSTGSWSNLSFEDDHPDESSSFLHLSDSSNGNSSSWSSLGLEGDIYEENLSFPTSDSDGTEDKEELKDKIEELGNTEKTLVIINVDVGPHIVDSQLRMTLQWLSASETEFTELHFRDDIPEDFILLSKRLREKGWKVGDLFQAVLKYCDMMEKAATDGERGLESKTFLRWFQDHV